MADFAYSDPARARRNVIRGAILWTPFFVLFAALAVSSLVRALDESGTAWVTFALTGLLALVTGDSAFAALRDLFQCRDVRICFAQGVLQTAHRSESREVI